MSLGLGKREGGGGWGERERERDEKRGGGGGGRWEKGEVEKNWNAKQLEWLFSIFTSCIRGQALISLPQSLDMGPSGPFQQIHPWRGMTAMDFLRQYSQQLRILVFVFKPGSQEYITVPATEQIYSDQWDWENNYHLFPFALNVFLIFYRFLYSSIITNVILN